MLIKKIESIIIMPSNRKAVKFCPLNEPRNYPITVNTDHFLLPVHQSVAVETTAPQKLQNPAAKISE